MRRTAIAAAAVWLMVVLASCVNAKAPERIEIGNIGSSSEDVDSSRVPHPEDMEEAQAELNKAYRQIQHLERRLADAEKDKRRYKEERDECEEKYDKLKDKYDD